MFPADNVLPKTTTQSASACVAPLPLAAGWGRESGLWKAAGTAETGAARHGPPRVRDDATRSGAMHRTYVSHVNEKASWVSGRRVFHLVSHPVRDEGSVLLGRE